MNSRLLGTRVRNLFKSFARVNPYKGALVKITGNYVETGLLMSLVAVLILLTYFVCQQANGLFERKQQAQYLIAQDMRLQKNNLLDIHPIPPEERLPAITVTTGGNSDSLFHFKKNDFLRVPTQLNQHQEENEHPNVIAEEAIGHTHIWRLEVNRLDEEALMQLLSNARKQLKSGDYELALKLFNQVLQQDEHHVLALAGMLFLSRLRGDSTLAQEYLQRLRHEVPDYLPDDSQPWFGDVE